MEKYNFVKIFSHKTSYRMIIKYVVDDFGSPFITNWGQIYYCLGSLY